MFYKQSGKLTLNIQFHLFFFYSGGNFPHFSHVSEHHMMSLLLWKWVSQFRILLHRPIKIDKWYLKLAPENWDEFFNQIQFILTCGSIKIHLWTIKMLLMLSVTINWIRDGILSNWYNMPFTLIIDFETCSALILHAYACLSIAQVLSAPVRCHDRVR